MSPPSAYRAPHPLAAAKPKRQFFDAFNSSATGHQRAENRLSGSTSWRESRTAKLGEQFADGERGGRRKADTIGAGSEGWKIDGRLENGLWMKGAKGLRDDGQKSMWQYAGCKDNGGAVIQDKMIVDEHNDTALASSSNTPNTEKPLEEVKTGHPPDDRVNESTTTTTATTTKSRPPQIFRNLTIYINGSTYPLISDHKLKRLLASHGAHLSIALGRRTVTHVILGTPNNVPGMVKNKGGAGGGLAGSKLQKEIKTVRGVGVKFVGVEWVLESVKAGKRLPEGRFAKVKLAMKGQGSVLEVFGAKEDSIVEGEEGAEVG